MDWSALRLFALGIGGAFILGSVLATAYYVGGAEPLFLEEPSGALSPGSPAPAPDEGGAGPLAGGPDGPDTSVAPPGPPPASSGPLRRTPGPNVPAGGAGGGSSGGSSGGSGSGGDGSGSGGKKDDGEENETDGGSDGLLPPPPDPDASLDDAVEAVDDKEAPDLPLEEPDVALPGSSEVSEPVDDVTANVPSAGTLMPGLTIPSGTSPAGGLRGL